MIVWLVLMAMGDRLQQKNGETLFVQPMMTVVVL